MKQDLPENPYEMKIHEATPSDATVIALLGRTTFTETFGHYFTDRTDLEEYLLNTFNVPKLKKSLAKPNTVYWVAHIDDLPVGYAKLKLNSPTELMDIENVCQLQKIYVLRDFLSKKVGFELQKILLQRATEEGFQKIWLSVLRENTRAIAFYSKNGFDTIGDHDFQIGKEHFEFQAMAKNLT